MLSQDAVRRVAFSSHKMEFYEVTSALGSRLAKRGGAQPLFGRNATDARIILAWSHTFWLAAGGGVITTHQTSGRTFEWCKTMGQTFVNPKALLHMGNGPKGGVQNGAYGLMAAMLPHKILVLHGKTLMQRWPRIWLGQPPMLTRAGGPVVTRAPSPQTTRQLLKFWQTA